MNSWRIDQETGPAIVLFRCDSTRPDGAADDPNIRPIANYGVDLKRKIATAHEPNAFG
jgi:hypothetical protein